MPDYKISRFVSRHVWPLEGPQLLNPVDAFFHLTNWLAPAVFVGVVLPLLARLAWRHELKALALRPAMLWCSVAGALVLVGGLLVFGRDGRIATYAAMLAAATLTLWWHAFRR